MTPNDRLAQRALRTTEEVAAQGIATLGGALIDGLAGLLRGQFPGGGGGGGPATAAGPEGFRPLLTAAADLIAPRPPRFTGDAAGVVEVPTDRGAVAVLAFQSGDKVYVKPPTITLPMAQMSGRVSNYLQYRNGLSAGNGAWGLREAGSVAEVGFTLGEHRHGLTPTEVAQMLVKASVEYAEVVSRFR